MNIAIYARVSSETQTKDGTIESQIEALREFAKAQKLTIVQECIDDGYSGADLNRPGLDRLRDLAQDGLIEGVLVLSPDRLSRKQAHQIILLEEFQKRNIQMLFTNQQFSDSPEDQLMMQIQGAISEYERTKILDRMRRGMKYAVKHGQVLGNRAPLGYRFIRKTENKPACWEVDPREAEIVRLVFDLYTNKSMNLSAIAKYLEEEGIPSHYGNTNWQSSTVYYILRNESYLGIAYMFKNRRVEPCKHPKLSKYRRRKYTKKEQRPRDEWIGIPITPLIDQNTWDAAQSIMKQNAKKSPRNNSKNQYMLRGLMVCGLCGCMASGYVSNTTTYYGCGAKRYHNITTKPHDERVYVRHKSFDAKVWDGLVELLNDPENLKAQLEKRLERRNGHITPMSSTNIQNEQALSKVNLQEQRVLDAYREGILSLDELKDQKEKITAKRKVVEAKIKAALSQQESLEQPQITMAMLGDVSVRFSRAMANATFEKRQKLANLLVNSVALYTDKAVVQGNIPIANIDALNSSNLWRANGLWTVYRRPNILNSNGHLW
jgi:site-specific DNA recombinase